ncbi:related to GIP2 Glc7p-interacting protein [Cephalotrichum gorgonifer]|uniref:Related to GIP2 Glc7p-interacting protein n=1 Tax=Cephalotrichum gorgonifer TaxID=2041049 RepID=A0AAE8MW92_9PEZI|nr:related to GIP2 Glc7p-interacting protein [Cephalotrichum gorgonifer]
MCASDSIRQSPPPVTGPGGIPSGAVISPPDSLSGSDDEGLMMRGRKITNLKELKVAVSHISVRRESSPSSERLPLVLSEAVSLTEGMHHSFSTGALDALGSQRNVLSDSDSGAEAIVGGSPLTASEEDSDDEKRVKPPMVRKKSGELVRPALRASSRRRPTSMPGTPTFSKAVHFDAHLEHVRHFLQVDRPLAVSAGSSPVENLESDSEYPFPSSEDEAPRSRSPPYEWELHGSNLSSCSDVARNSLPAKVERFWLSKDCRSLQGSVSVANLAFNKHVICRFTLDDWKTTSEVAAEYTGPIHGTPRERWTFTIRLSDMANLETKIMYFCIRYNVNGQEYWDNNGGSNFNVGFHKKYLPQNGKGGYRGAGSRAVGELPRSTRRADPDSASRPKSTPMAGGFPGARHTFDQGRDTYGDESVPIRLKRHTANSRSEDFTSSTAPRNRAFGRRYDFNASLHEAKNSARARDSRVPTDANANANKSNSPIFLPSGNDSPSRKDYTYDEIVNRFCFVLWLKATVD